MTHVFPPFDPEEPRPTGRRVRASLGRRRRHIPVRLIIPNLFTIMGLCAGLTAIRMAVEHRFDVAIAALVLAALLDGMDGRIARLLKATSRFGAELDSLADFVDFGVAPAIILFTWALQDKGSLGWIVVLVFAVCAALRLARFNVALGEPNQPDWKSNFFVGVPAPAAALAAMLPLYLSFALDMPAIRELTIPIMIYTLIIAVLMVSRVPTYSGKNFTRKIEREFVLPIFLAVAFGVAVLFSYPYATLAAVTVLYLATIPLGLKYYQRLAMAAQASARDAHKPASTSAAARQDSPANGSTAPHPPVTGAGNDRPTS